MIFNSVTFICSLPLIIVKISQNYCQAVRKDRAFTHALLKQTTVASSSFI